MGNANSRNCGATTGKHGGGTSQHNTATHGGDAQGKHATDFVGVGGHEGDELPGGHFAEGALGQVQAVFVQDGKQAAAGAHAAPGGVHVGVHTREARENDDAHKQDGEEDAFGQVRAVVAKPGVEQKVAACVL